MTMGVEQDLFQLEHPLKELARTVWSIVVPTFQGVGTEGSESVGTRFVPTGTFTEGMLRIEGLEPDWRDFSVCCANHR